MTKAQQKKIALVMIANRSPLAEGCAVTGLTEAEVAALEGTSDEGASPASAPTPRNRAVTLSGCAFGWIAAYVPADTCLQPF